MNVHVLKRVLKSRYGNAVAEVIMDGKTNTIYIYINGDKLKGAFPKTYLNYNIVVLENNGSFGSLSPPPMFPKKEEKDDDPPNLSGPISVEEDRRTRKTASSTKQAKVLVGDKFQEQEITTIQRKKKANLSNVQHAEYMVGGKERNRTLISKKIKSKPYTKTVSKAKILSGSQVTEARAGFGQEEYRKRTRTLDAEDYSKEDPYEMWNDEAFQTEIIPESGGQDPRKRRNFEDKEDK